MTRLNVITFFMLSLFISTFAFSQKFNSVVDFTHGYLLGGMHNASTSPGAGNNSKASAGISGKNVFIKAVEASDKCKINDSYKLYNLSGYLGSGICENIITDQPPCQDLFYIGIKTEIKPDENDRIIALSGNWDACPKTLKIESTKQKTYQDIVTDLLHKRGVKNPKVKLNEVIRTDIEGDGVKEVIISANSHFDSFHDKIQGDYYSIIILRKIIKGKVENILITCETKMAEIAYVNKVIGILDIDNDGKMEIITSSAYYEGDTTIIYKLDGNKVKEILSEGCGV